MEPAKNNDNFNDDELKAPDWLSAQFFEEILVKHEKAQELKIVDVKISPATGKGDHYASIMFRGNVEYTTQMGKFSKLLIIKSMPEQEGHKKQMLNNSHFFETEIGMYSKVLPKFEKILREAGDNTRLYAPCIYYSSEPRQVLIFEDLVSQGYVCERNRDATVEELKAAYSKIAKWHAVSFQILHEEPDFLQEFKHGLISMPHLMNDPFMTTGLSNFLEFLDKVPELTKYKAYFKSKEHTYLDIYRKVLEEYRKNRQPDGYYVLSHGDFHLLNMMFKHNKINGTLEDCMLLDFQISNVCPITIDLIYSTYMLMGPETRRNNYKELIDFYFNVFVETLQKIGFKGELPSSVEFWKQISNHKFYEMFHILTLLPMVCGLKSKVYGIGDIMQSEDIRKKLYFLDEYVEDVKYLLSRYEKLGYFE